MDMYSISYSLLTGALLGFFYGYSFVLQQKSIFTSKLKTIGSVIIASLRIIVAGIVFTISLRTEQINPILLIVAFVIIFWIVFLVRKDSLYARSSAHR